MTPTLTPARQWPETHGRHAYDWLSAEDVIRYALASYYALCRQFDALPADPRQVDGQFSNARATLADELSEDFSLRIHQHGYQRGAPGFYEEAGQMLALRHGPQSPDRAIRDLSLMEARQ